MEQEVAFLDGRITYENPWMQIREDQVQFADGSRGIYGVVHKSDFAVVLPFENDGFWLVEQYRYPIGRRSWEFPLGAWPAGHHGSLYELARAELSEETGLRAAEWTSLGELHTAPGVQSNRYEVYLATSLTPGDHAREATESDLVCEWRSTAQLRQMIRDGDFQDAQSVAAYALLLLQQPGL